MGAKTSVGIIGTGRVGASVAISTLHSGLAQRLLLHDVDEEQAEGEALDLAHGAPFYPTASLELATPKEMQETSAVVVAAGRGGEGDESRLDLLRDNAGIIRNLAPEFSSYEGVVVIVSNPVDVLTYEFQRASGLPPERVIGTGTMLDTARLRQMLGRELEINPSSVDASVIGEHGDSEVILWSSATLAGRALRDWPGWSAEKEEAIAEEVRTAAYKIVERKGATNHAIGLVAASLLTHVLRGERSILTVSRVQDGALGLDDVAISLPTIVGEGGASEVLVPDLSSDERSAFQKSAEVLKEAIDSIRE